MNKRRLSKIVGILTVLALLLVYAGLTLAQDGETPHFTYEGEDGPEHWGELSEDWVACSTGTSQTPIDIETSAVGVADEGAFPTVEMDYHPSKVHIANNGHTIVFNYDAGSTLTINGVVYTLLQFHFHIPSEHTLNEAHTAMELHLVHRNEAQELAVLGIFIEPFALGGDLFAGVWDQIPAEEGEVEVDAEINAAEFLPADFDLITYSGSLTTPPCSEGVTWLLADVPMTFTQDQIDHFASIFPLNARPVQPLNDRDVVSNE